MSYKVEVDGAVIGEVNDLPGMTLIGSALELAGDFLNTAGFPDPSRSTRPFGEHSPKSVILTGTTIKIESWK